MLSLTADDARQDAEELLRNRHHISGNKNSDFGITDLASNAETGSSIARGLSEGLGMIGGLGGLGGLGLAALGAAGINALDKVVVRLSTQHVVVAVGIASLVGLIFGY
ncbi:hypothetical protein ACS5PK_20550 [Roseateles sp. DB2]|uniref:hypothetical protein n=1 Tax=Roseateles sp. DB2 TaxID=3453717 RepID=UPI003EEF2AB9